jgi:hypothetical protein
MSGSATCARPIGRSPRHGRPRPDTATRARLSLGGTPAGLWNWRPCPWWHRCRHPRGEERRAPNVFACICARRLAAVPVNRGDVERAAVADLLRTGYAVFGEDRCSVHARIVGSGEAQRVDGGMCVLCGGFGVPLEGGESGLLGFSRGVAGVGPGRAVRTPLARGAAFAGLPRSSQAVAVWLSGTTRDQWLPQDGTSLPLSFSKSVAASTSLAVASDVSARAALARAWTRMT